MSERFVTYDFQFEGETVRPGRIILLKSGQKVVFIRLESFDGKTHLIGESKRVEKRYPINNIRSIQRKRSQANKCQT